MNTHGDLKLSNPMSPLVGIKARHMYTVLLFCVNLYRRGERTEFSTYWGGAVSTHKTKLRYARDPFQCSLRVSLTAVIRNHSPLSSNTVQEVSAIYITEPHERAAKQISNK